MTDSGSPPSWGLVLKAALPALVIGAIVGWALQYVDLARGVRVGAAFFVFVVLHNWFFERFSGLRRPAQRWAGTIAIALAGAVAVGLISGF